MNQSSPGILHLEFVIAEVLPDAVLELPEDGYRLHETRSSDRMTTSEQAARRIYRQFPSQVGITLLYEATSLAVLAEPKVFICLQLA